MTMTSVTTPYSVCRFGLARCDITPPVGIYHRMWGAATHDRATGVHRPLTATALAVQPIDIAGSQPPQLVIVAVDHCLLWANEMEALLQKVASRCELPSDRLLIAFSHTHSSGLMGSERIHLPGGALIPVYLEQLADSLASIVSRAISTAQPVTITYGFGRCSLAANRDFWDAASQQFVCGFNPGGVGDETILIARVSDVSDRTVATVVNYACHPTTLAWENTLISPDYPGAMREVVEQGTGAPCVFLQGASGDIGPRHGYVGDVSVADRNGRSLGYAALAAFEALPPAATSFEYSGPVVSGATLGAWEYRPLERTALERCSRFKVHQFLVDLPYRTDLPTMEQATTELRSWEARERAAVSAGNLADARDARAMAERMTRIINRLVNLPPGSEFPLPVTVWQAGDACWVAVECEHYNLLQRSLRERFADRPVVVLTLVNGSRATYLPTRETYGKGIYQESIALLAPGSLERLINAIGDQIESL